MDADKWSVQEVKKREMVREGITLIHTVIGDLMMALVTVTADREFIVSRLKSIRARVDHILKELGAE